MEYKLLDVKFLGFFFFLSSKMFSLLMTYFTEFEDIEMYFFKHFWFKNLRTSPENNACYYKKYFAL